ncbi:MAG TPA: hypothetical protein VLH56_18805 [Dissulfurispiraceae bacterium]|nr:hypothetical protein [Dissulfurispiraceae bacterium]
MPRVKEEKVLAEGVATSVPSSEAIEPKVEKKAKRKLVDSTMSAATVIELDLAGVELLFEQKEDFLALPEEIVRSLSRDNRSRYSVARQYHETWRGADDKEFVERFSISAEANGSASDKINQTKVRKGLRERWCRPDTVNRRLAEGYKVLNKDEATTFLGSKGGHHEISKDGKTELVLMGIPEELYQKRQKAKIAKNAETASMWKQSGKRELERNGAPAFDEDTEDKRLSWKDI